MASHWIESGRVSQATAGPDLALRDAMRLEAGSRGAFQGYANLAAEATGCPIAAFNVVGPERVWAKAGLGLDRDWVEREHAICAHAVLTPDRPLVVPDLSQDPRFADNPLVRARGGLRFYAGMPIVTSAGRALGTICVMDRRPRSLGGAQLMVLQDLALTLSGVLELWRSLNPAAAPVH